ncbi:hypothetical protein [Rheinheimera gaetbuli]
MRHLQTNQRIALLATQLPLQRRQLAGQTTTLMQAVGNDVSSPATLAAVAVGGALVGWCWFRPAEGGEQDGTGGGRSDGQTGKVAAPVIGSLLRQSLSAAFMAYLARSLA